MSLAVVGGFMLLALFGLPIAFAMGVAALAALWATGVDFSMVPQRMMYAVNSFPLMSIPFFMLAGELMIKAGIVERLIDPGQHHGRPRARRHGARHHDRGRRPGDGLGHRRLGRQRAVVHPGAQPEPDLRQGIRGGDRRRGGQPGPDHSAVERDDRLRLHGGIDACRSAACSWPVSCPGLIVALGFMALCSWIAVRRGWAATGEPFRLRVVLVELRRSLIVLAMPVLVIGGIVGGAFTATEGSAIAVVYAMAIGFFVTRTLKVSDLPGLAVRAAITSAVVGALIAFASVITYLMTVDLMPQKLTVALHSLTTDPMVFLLLVALLLFVVGMFLESNAAYIMLVPLLHPIAIQYGIDPLHFGFLFVLNLVIGMLTPPVGVVLFVVCGVTGVRMRELVVNVWPFIALMYAVLVLCMFFPAVVLALPRALGY